MENNRQNRPLNKVGEINSQAETGEVNKNLMEFLEEAAAKMTGKIYLLVHKHHEVLIGEIRDGKIGIKDPEQLSPGYLQEMRMFSLSGELYIWNKQGQLKYRLRLDYQGETTHQYDEDHFMWGQKPKEKLEIDNQKLLEVQKPFLEKVSGFQKQDFAVIEPNRGMRLTFPFPVAEEDCPLKYRVRNYLEFDDHGHLRFYDARLMTFLNKEGKEMES